MGGRCGGSVFRKVFVKNEIKTGNTGAGLKYLGGNLQNNELLSEDHFLVFYYLLTNENNCAR